MRVKALSGFWYESKLVKAGTETEVDDSCAREVISSGKAVAVSAPPPTLVKADTETPKK